MRNGFTGYWKRILLLGAQRSWKWLGVSGKILNVAVGLIVGVLLGQKDIIRISLITIGIVGGLYLILVMIFAFFIVPFQENNKLAKTISRLKSRRKEPPALLELTKLRKAGIELRNSGISLSSPAELDSWLNEFETWNVQVLKLIRKLSKVRAGIIETLGNLPRGGYPNAINDVHRLKLNVFDEKLKRLQTFLEEYVP
jgi:hypothetical protein